MRKVIFLILAVAVLASGNLAGAAPATPHVSDACGDADRMVSVAGQGANSPDAARAAGFDVKAAWFEDVVEGEEHLGVRVNLQLCGAVPAVELAGSSWSVHWEISENCSAVVSLLDTIDMADPSTGVVRGARLEKHCSSTSQGPLPSSSTTTVRTEWIRLVDDYSVTGDTVSWVLTPDMVTGGGENYVEFLSPEAVWTGPRAHARDARWGTEASDGTVAPVRITGPGAYDSTEPGLDFTVGDVTE